MKNISVTKEIPVIAKYDVLVCGGGSAGWVSAVSSARAGKKTALIERFGFLGGTATAGYVIPLSGCFYNGERVVGGIAWEFVQKMVAKGGALVELPKGHVSFDPEVYKVTAYEMVTEAGVDVYSNSYITYVGTEGRDVKYVVIESKNGAEAIEADVVIDATGDGDICHMTGVEMLPVEEELQPMSMCFLLGGADLTTDLLKNNIHHDGKACKQSVHTEIHDYLEGIRESEDVPQFGGPWFNTAMMGDLVAVNITRASANAADRAELTEAERKMRSDAHKILDLLKKKYPEFKNSYIASTAFSAGVRETRRIKGIKTLSGQSVLDGVECEDSIARMAHPMDIHSAKDNSQILIHLTNAGKIPYGTMIPQEYDNLLAVGRCSSADRSAYASMRVQATLMAMGEAAGVAASIKEGAMKDVNIKELQKILTERGAII